MPDSKTRIRLAFVIFWLLLFYVVAALVWWFISLESQNRQMQEFKIAQLNISIDKRASPDLYQYSLSRINDEHRRNFIKYIGEGFTFLILILIGAAFVYRSVRRQLKMQQQQQNFMMAVTHELKTPISVARLNLETLQRYQLDEEKRQKLLKITLAETERLNTLTNNILVSSQLEGGHYKLSTEEIDLSDLLKDCLRHACQRYPERKFVEEIQEDMNVMGDPLLLQLLINNLIENAVKYSSKEKQIIARLHLADKKIRMEIIDEGAGIPNEEKKKVFGKFYRIGNESTRKTQGTGLGLYLCRIIARDHGSEIFITDNQPHGSNFTVVFNPE
ncbi:MAG: two-component sensor histidine kinase [Chitinophagaceae bacterium]